MPVWLGSLLAGEVAPFGFRDEFGTGGDPTLWPMRSVVRISVSMGPGGCKRSE